MKNIEGATSEGWAESAPPLVGIGLTDLPNIGVPVAPLAPPGSDITGGREGSRSQEGLVTSLTHAR